jgi:hypothetical protein
MSSGGWLVIATKRWFLDELRVAESSTHIDYNYLAIHDKSVNLLKS